MTAQEQKTLEELGMTPEQLAERTERANAIARGELNPNQKALLMRPAHDPERQALESALARPARAPRRDKGVPRKKREPQAAAPGALSSLEASKFESAVEMLVVAEQRVIELTKERDHLRSEVKRYFSMLTAK